MILKQSVVFFLFFNGGNRFFGNRVLFGYFFGGYVYVVHRVNFAVRKTNRVFALFCFDNRVGNNRRNELNRPDSVVVARNYVIYEVGVAVGIGDGYYGDAEFAGFLNGYIFAIWSSLLSLSTLERMVLKLVRVPPSHLELI